MTFAFATGWNAGRQGLCMKRWNGQEKSNARWDDLRRDPDIWFPGGDCLVHLFSSDEFYRSSCPSFRISLGILRQRKCYHLLERYLLQDNEVVESRPSKSSSRSGASDLSFADVPYSLYISAPENLSRDDAFTWQITTRNFFAWLMGKPLVGLHIGQALADLRDRIELFKPGASTDDDLMKYIEEAGYLDFENCADHALALLYYAELTQNQDLWVDAFAHCVGMNANLHASPGFQAISRVTKVLITRSYLEMDLHLTKMSGLLKNFLEDDLSASHLGLPESACRQLDLFRTFLQSFYVAKLGYWPPQSPIFPRTLLRAMYEEFRNLYDFLLDPESTNSLDSLRPALGGICVLQNVQAFDQRQKYDPLPHPLPLIPSSVDQKSQSSSHRIPLLSSILGSGRKKIKYARATQDVLLAATNVLDPEISTSPLVIAFSQFERDCAMEERVKISLQDARKVRWIMVYAILQVLISVIRAPNEVRQTTSTTYSLCCTVTSSPPWKSGAKSLMLSGIPSFRHSAILIASPKDILFADNRPSSSHSLCIQPDCETDEYFFKGRSQANSRIASRANSRTNSRANSRANSPSRRASFKIPQSLHKSKSMNAKSSSPSPRASRRLSFPATSRSNSKGPKVLPPTPSCEIYVPGYGNGLNVISRGEISPVTPISMTFSQSPTSTTFKPSLVALHKRFQGARRKSNRVSSSSSLTLEIHSSGYDDTDGEHVLDSRCDDDLYHASSGNIPEATAALEASGTANSAPASTPAPAAEPDLAAPSLSWSSSSGSGRSTSSSAGSVEAPALTFSAACGPREEEWANDAPVKRMRASDFECPAPWARTSSIIAN